jgi:putative ABC transport system ATP-binding protein
LVSHIGEMLFIVGPSGSGKMTMLSMISGILCDDVRLVAQGEPAHASTRPGISRN